MIYVGIVGHEAAKFTRNGEQRARGLIFGIIDQAARAVGMLGLRTKETIAQVVVVSGECPLGGIDIWAKEIAHDCGAGYKGFPPEVHAWDPGDGRIGFMRRNIQIAETSNLVHNLVVDRYPHGFNGRRFTHCYHCDVDDHIKSGGCWTMRYAERLGKRGIRHVISNFSD